MIIAGMVQKSLELALTPFLEPHTSKLAGRFLQRKGLSQAIERQFARQVEQFATSELGFPMHTRYRDVYEFVDEIVLDLYPAQTGGDIRWCAKWWAHPAAVRRLTMMWASWEVHRAENPATGEEVWARYVGDYHFRWLTGQYGPFGRCSQGHNPSPQLPHDPIPMTTVVTAESGSTDTTSEGDQT
jgi:hypothetical protein